MFRTIIIFGLFVNLMFVVARMISGVVYLFAGNTADSIEEYQSCGASMAFALACLSALRGK